MSEVQKCPLCGGEVHYEHAETRYVCKTYCCPYTADFILHFRVADVLAARDAEIAKLRALLERMDELCVVQSDFLLLECPVCFNNLAADGGHTEKCELGLIIADIRAALKEGGSE